MTAEGQAHVFAAMALLGAAFGVIYDAGMLLRRAMHAGKGTTAVMDIAFGVFCAVGMIASALQLRVQAARWYVFAGVMTGMAMQQATTGRLLRGIMRFVRKMTSKGRTNEKNGAD